MEKAIRSLVITGYGINCEKEMALAAKVAGADCDICHLNLWLATPHLLDDYHLLLFPGGFSYADELGAGKALANKIKHTEDPVYGTIQQRLFQFVQSGKCILGVCNGFQLLIKLGLLPGYTEDTLDQVVALTSNDKGRFENRWCHHRVPPSPCVFTRGLDALYLPIRHGEGRLVFPNEGVHQRVSEDQLIALQYADTEGRVSMNYPENPNGSCDAIAALCDPTGRILGMMAHPEAYLFPHQHPCWSRRQWENGQLPAHGDGYFLFRNAVEYLQESTVLEGVISS